MQVQAPQATPAPAQAQATPAPAPAQRCVTSSFLTSLSPRLVDQVGSFLDTGSLTSFSRSCRRTQWTFEARLKMNSLLSMRPEARDAAIGPHLGLAVVYKKGDNKPTLIKICSSPSRSLESFIWNAVLVDSRVIGGGIQVAYQRKKGPYGDALATYIERMSGSEKYSGVGTALVQAVMEACLSGSEFRLFVDAAGGSATFYWKLGMRSLKEPGYVHPRHACQMSREELRDIIERSGTNPWIARRVLELRRNGQSRPESDEEFGGYVMYLHPDAFLRWAIQICQDPVLLRTRQQLAY